MEIHVNRKLVIVIVAVVISLGGLIYFLQPSRATPPASGAVTSAMRMATHTFDNPPSVSSNDPGKAATDFAVAFYTVDYREYEGWLNGLRVVSTDEGYAILLKSIAPVVWPEIQKARTVTAKENVQAKDVGLALAGDSQIGGPWQIRTVQIHIDSDHLWPTMKSSDFSALIMLANQKEQWRFMSFITPDQMDQIRKGQQP